MRFRAATLGVSMAVLPFLGNARGSVDGLLRNATDSMRRAGAPGVSIVAVVKGRTFFANAGSSDLEGTPVTERTLFETASISKVFTTSLLGIDVARGRTRLDTRITKYFHLPVTPEMSRATLAMLATYTAGIPNLPPALAGRPSQTWGVETYPVKSFLRFVGRLRPAALPAPAVYSDSSVGFLALCLGHLSLAKWESLEQENLYRPLDMPDTAARLTAEQETRLARGILPDGTEGPRWPFDPFVAADGVKSTTHDLGHFLAAELGHRPGVPRGLARGLAIATQPRFDIAGGTERQALAWTWVPGSVDGKPVWIIMKGGNLVGFSSRICFNRRLGVGVAILANHANLPTQQVAMNLLQRIAGEVNSVASIQAER